MKMARRINEELIEINEKKKSSQGL